MGLISVFKTFGKGFVEVGKGAVKVIDVAADVVTGPAAVLLPRFFRWWYLFHGSATALPLSRT